MKNIFLLIMTISFFGCRPDARQNAADRAAFKEVQLICEDMDGHDNTPHSAVYAILKDSKVKLAEIHGCNTIESEDYENHHIPEDAIIAVGGVGDGHSEYVYAQVSEEDKNELRFYINTLELENNQGKRTALASYKKDKFQVLRPLHLADIAGYYMHESQDSSYVLFLGMKGPELIAKLFATDEPMPARKMLQRALPEFESTPDTDFSCELSSLIFHSDMGNGTVFWRPDSAAVVFNPFLDKKGEVVFELIQF